MSHRPARTAPSASPRPLVPHREGRRPRRRALVAHSALAGAALVVTGAAGTTAPELAGDILPPPAVCPHPLASGLDLAIASAALSGPASAAMGDVDGDGRDEYVVGSEEEDGVVVLLGVSGGRFGRPVTIPVPFARPDRVFLLHLDGDGDLDLVVGSRPEERMAGYLNDGRGGFEPAWSRESEADRIDVLETDDGRFLVDRNPVGIIVASRLTDGVPGFPVEVPMLDAVMPFAADVNGDGLEDLGAVRSIDGAEDALLLARPDGTWSPEIPIATDGIVGRLRVADMTSDGRTDLLWNGTGTGIAIVPGLPGERGFDDPVFIGSLGVGPFAPFDLGGDGAPDLVAGGFGPLVAVRFDGGDGFDVLPASPYRTADSLGVGDGDGDGLDDVVLARTPNEIVGVATMLRGRDGVVAPGGGRELSVRSTIAPIALPRPGAPTAVALYDDSVLRARTVEPFSGTSSLIAWSGGASGGVSMRPTLGTPPGTTRFLFVLAGAEDGLNARPVILDGTTLVPGVPMLPGSLASHLAEGDVDGDGDVDGVAVVGGAADPPRRLLLRTSDGTLYADGVEHPLASEVAELVVADVNGDGLADAAILDAGGRLHLALGDGDAGLLAPIAAPGPDLPPGDGLMQPVDWDGDARHELLAVASGGAGRLYRWEDGLPRTAVLDVDAPMPGPFTSLAVGDLDGAGGPDVALERATDWPLVLGLGTGPADAPRLEVRTRLLAGSQRTPLIVDLDGDGLGELVTRRPDGTLTVHPGSACPPPCLGDLDADGDVDFEDLLVLLGPIDPAVASPWSIWDLDDDLDRDADDVLVLLSSWGPCPDDE